MDFMTCQTCIRIYNAKKKKSRSREILIQKSPVPLVHSHSVLVFSTRQKESRLNGV